MTDSRGNSIAPIIIIGMHRSGTSMITRMLQRLGLFVGVDLEPNSESWFFINHNDWLLRQSGAAWHNPNAIDWLLQNRDVRKLAEEYTRSRLTGFPIARFLGWKQYLRDHRPLDNMTGPWGWKDPRTTFTLPFWIGLFPDARVIHIYRNGVPVAASLRARDRKGLELNKSWHVRRGRFGLYNLRAKKGGFVNSIRCLDLAGAFSLWEEYVSRAILETDHIGAKSMTVKYEEFLNDPKNILEKLALFCGLEASEQEFRTISGQVNRDRALAFQADSELADFYVSVKERPLMKSLGYSK